MKKIKKYKYIALLITIFSVIMISTSAYAIPIPKIPGLSEAKNPRDVSLTLELLFIFTVLSLAPGIIMMVTAFTRIVIVLLLLQRALSLTNAS